MFGSKKRELTRKVNDLTSQLAAKAGVEEKLTTALLEKNKLADQLEAHKTAVRILPLISMSDRKSQEALASAIADTLNDAPQKTVYLGDRDALNKAFWEAVDPLAKAGVLKTHTVDNQQYGADVDLGIFSKPLKTSEAALAVLRGISEELAQAKPGIVSIKIELKDGGVSLQFTSESGSRVGTERMRALVEAAQMLGMESGVNGSSVFLVAPKLA
ncbi:MAG: hypothetical protein WC717_01845 [Candidatus Micrarchaeia archaeon]|jgi:hypothetical protein